MRMFYLHNAEHSVMQNQRRVVFRDDRADQDAFYKVPRGHQDVKLVTAVLHARLQDLRRDGDASAAGKLKRGRKQREHEGEEGATLTVSASMTSLKFRFPTILFFKALTASLDL